MKSNKKNQQLNQPANKPLRSIPSTWSKRISLEIWEDLKKPSGENYNYNEDDAAGLPGEKGISVTYQTMLQSLRDCNQLYWGWKSLAKTLTLAER